MAKLSIAAALLLSVTVVAAQPFNDCDTSTYYGTSSPLTTSRSDMHNLLRSTHRDQLPYTNSNYGDTWDALIALDNPNNVDDSTVRLIYGDKLVPSVPYDYGTCAYWNREHLWSRSHGVGSSGKDNTDLHHLRPSDCNVNTARSNKYFANCGIVSPLSECVVPAHVEAANDTAKDTQTFLPPTDRRGDIARAILYMDLRYDGDERSTINLVVSDCPETIPNNGGMGYLSELLQWHLDDPPDNEERVRNDNICKDWQGNRNPFVDFPELAGVYHGESRPLKGEGLGYDCNIPPPPAPTSPPTQAPPMGMCSDMSGECSSVDDCMCSSSSRLLRGMPSSRNLQASGGLIVSGLVDGPLPGGLPKMVELYALQDVPDLSLYGVGSANNGGGSDGQEYTLSDSTTAGSFITVSYETAKFVEYFNTEPDFVTGRLNINGDDAIELFYNGEVVDTFGDAHVDGSNKPWEYQDSWAYRTVSASSGAFEISEWTIPGKDSLDGCTSNDSCSSTFPLNTFVGSEPACECEGLIA